MQPNRFVGFDARTHRYISNTEVGSGGGTIRHMYFHKETNTVWFRRGHQHHRSRQAPAASTRGELSRAQSHATIRILWSGPRHGDRSFVLDPSDAGFATERGRPLLPAIRGASGNQPVSIAISVTNSTHRGAFSASRAFPRCTCPTSVIESPSYCRARTWELPAFKPPCVFSGGDHSGMQAGRLEPYDTRVVVRADHSTGIEYAQHSARGSIVEPGALAVWSFFWTAPREAGVVPTSRRRQLGKRRQLTARRSDLRHPRDHQGRFDA